MQQEFMERALELAQEALNLAEVPVGCVLVRDGKVVAKGRNMTTESGNATMHAEIVAIETLQNIADTIYMDLYVTIEPCIMCAAALRQLGIRHVFFGAFNDKFGGCGSVYSLHNNHQSPFQPYPVTSGILAKEAIIILRRFYITENENAPVPRKKTNRILKLE